jgi:hypothetical protein
MPKLRKEEVADLDIRELDEAEYSEDEYETYEGDIPPAGTELTGYLKGLWWCRTQEKADGSGLDPMLKALWIAADNDGDNEQYNGLPIFENAVLIPSAKFRWAGFLRAFGITLKAIKTSTYLISEETDNRMGGAPIERIGQFHPGEDHDEAWSRVVTERHRWNDEWSARAKRWLPWEDEDTDEEPEDVTDEEEPEDEDEEYDEDEEEGDEPEDEEEDEEPEAPSLPRRARGSRTASKAPATRAARSTRSTSAKPATARRTAGTRTSNDGRKSGTAGSRSTSRVKAGATTRPAGRGRGRTPATASDDEPPF